MKVSFCVGNGESRKGYDLRKLKPYGEIYGANALYRDITVDHLVCCDRKMCMETVQKEYTGTVYTRKDWFSFFPYKNYKQLPDLPWKETEKYTQSFHMGSGLHAVNLALRNESNIVVLIGHDFWGTNNLHNNVYKGTSNYWAKEHHAIDPSFWIKQFVLFFRHYPHVNFVFAQPNINQWNRPPGWEDVFENVMFQELRDLADDLHITQG